MEIRGFSHLAFMGPLSSVSPHVSVELARVLKGSVADVALVGTFLGVDAAVHVQVLLDTESLLTELTPEKSQERKTSVMDTRSH